MRIGTRGKDARVRIGPNEQRKIDGFPKRIVSSPDGIRGTTRPLFPA
ncbi:hypothetical protein [Longimicrobium terrae]|uniref:Uncharacterized protein n=1 Tax=Longimicrobium terrae TaxID=1639882 RepID=A0A841GUS3_9BACT|nr:hypothetical protein [Longimicrobium terrae]MBB4634186.1 hypothetical protein [Longimicrobium terrae]MBB6068924.1 hypothetical protein [Longimicrobium terrae]NNC28104.1 hypothetical protein [Longimicrobium terrae]